MSGLDSVKAERYPPLRDASLQRLREMKQSMAQRRSLNPPRPVPKAVPMFVAPKTEPPRPEPPQETSIPEEEIVVSSVSAEIVEPEVGSGAGGEGGDNSTNVVTAPCEVEAVVEPKKRKEVEDILRRTIKAETELQNGMHYAEQLKVKLLEEDNEKLRIALKQAQKVPIPQASSPSDSAQAEVRKLTSILEEKRVRSEKGKLKEQLDSYIGQFKTFKESSEAHIKVLEHEKETLTERLRKARSEQSLRGDEKFAEYVKEKESLYKQLSDANETIDDLSQCVRDREDRIIVLERQLEEIDAEEAQKTMNAVLQHGPIPEPPPEHFSPILDIHPQHKARPLVADVGSTGTSSVRHHAEEFKELSHYASPAPQETHYQSTGETLHDPRLYDTGAATPPMEQPWVETSIHSHTNSESRTPPIVQRSLDVDPGFSSSEEEKERSLGTPKRDEALSGHDSRSSTPPRQRFGGEKSNTPQPQQNPNQRVHNLTQPNYPMHYSIPAPTADLSRPTETEAEDFFAQMQYDGDARRRHFDPAV